MTHQNTDITMECDDFSLLLAYSVSPREIIQRS